MMLMRQSLYPATLQLSFRTWGTAVADLLFPPRCVACDAWGRSFCDACAQQVDPVPLPICSSCGRPQQTTTQRCSLCQQVENQPLTLARAAVLFTHPLRSAVHSLKYKNCPELASSLARYLVAAYQQAPWPELHPAIDWVVPVPLHRQRLQERGYNQAQLLAEEFAHKVGLPMQSDLLARTRFTTTQVGLNARERQQNVADAFHGAPAVRAKRILLVDDVFTTGATLSACAEALLTAGASRVYALCLATPALTPRGPARGQNAPINEDTFTLDAPVPSRA